MISLKNTLATAAAVTTLIMLNSEVLYSQNAWKTGGNNLSPNSDNSIGTKSTSTTTDFNIITDGAERITILGDNGFVGIGTTTPGCSFDVQGEIRSATLSGFGSGIATFADDGILQPLSFTGSANDVLLGDGAFTSTSALGFLSLTGGTLTGNLTVNGSVDASSYTLNGVPLSGSPWTSLSNDIYYNAGRVAIGKNTAPLATLEVIAAPQGAETILRASVADATNVDYFSLTNVTGNNGRLVMSFNGHRGSNNDQTMFFQASVISAQDDSMAPLISYIAKQLNGTTSSNIVDRPLFEWRNYRDIHMIMNKDGDVKIGNVGTYGQFINPANFPTEKLDVGGNLRVRGTADALAYTVNGVPLQSSPWSTSGNDISYTGGKVGIGTSNPSTDFEVDGQMKVTERITIGTSSLIMESFDPQNIGPVNQIYTSNGDLLIQSQNSFNTIISRRKESRVGIGTLSPQKKLHIKTDHSGLLPSSSSHQGIRLEDLTGSNAPFFTSVWDLEPEFNNGLSFLNIGTPSSPKMTITEQGKVGIGTISPLQTLDVLNTALIKSEDATEPSLHFRTLPTGAYSEIRQKKDANGKMRLAISMDPNNNGLSATEAMSITEDGNVRIGTFITPIVGRRLSIRGANSSGLDQIFTLVDFSGVHDMSLGYENTDNIWKLRVGGVSPQSAFAIDCQGSQVALFELGQLTVCGKIRTNEVIVETFGCDFVFDDDYKLRSISELEKYIGKNNHLPEIPSAREIETNGMEVGDFQSRLLWKIEELSLYVIELKNDYKELKAQMELK